MPPPDHALAPLIRTLAAGPSAVDLDGGLRLAIGGRTGAATSRAAAGRVRVALSAPSGLVGVDVETLGRVALNAAPDDAWLTAAERALVAAAADPVLEMAAHWVLIEAYGKALGVGLALPLDRIGFGARAGAIALSGASGDGWCFALYRVGDAVIGTAHRSGGDAVGSSGKEAADSAAGEV